MKQWLKTKKGRLQALGILLVCLVVLSLILFNTLVEKIVKRYSLYTPLTAAADYDVSDECFALLDRVFQNESASVTLLFLREREDVDADKTERYLLKTAESIAERYAQVQISFCDPIENPETLRPYTVVKDVRTGKVSLDEEGNPKTRTLPENGLIILCGDYVRVYDLEEFFTFEGGDLSKVTAYGGESKLTAGILHAIKGEAPLACLTNNHGETFYDYELLYLLDDAGYAVDYLDLSKEEIPANCRLVVTYNPNADFLDSDGVTASETDCLGDFLSQAGNHFLLFAGSATPRLASLEQFLLRYGVEFAYSDASAEENVYRYSVKDDSATLTSDGYSIYGKAESELTMGVKDSVVFQNATAIRVASGFINRQNGRYEKGNMTLRTLYTASDRAAAFASGRQVGAGAFQLATLTEITLDGGSSSVAVIASTDFCEERFLQSAVYGNRDALLRLCKGFGAGENPEGLTIKPFSSDRMSLVTTRQKFLWTAVLVALPILLCGAFALVVLVRRRNR